MSNVHPSPVRKRPPEQVNLDVLVLRRSSPDDAELVAAAVASNLQHLEPWLPWASPAAGITENQRQRLVEASAAWDDGREFEYLLLEGKQLAGVFGLHRRVGPHALELGYWLCENASGRGRATAAAKALTAAALDVDDVERVEIRCDKANLRSQLVPERLGYRLDRIEADDIEAPAELGQSMVWVFPPNT